MYIVLILILAVLVMIFISIATVYKSISLVELKRRARNGQHLAKSLYRVASYKYSSQFLLLLLATISATAFFYFVSEKSPVWVALTADFALVWLAYVWIPRGPVNTVSQYLAQILSRPLGWALEYLHPLFKHVHKKTSRMPHTGLYELSDIVRLLTVQQKQKDNRIDEFEINLLKHVLNFSHYQVVDIMTPKRKVHSISIKDILGPIVLSELHKTGHTHFPVFEGKATNVVGILSIAGYAHTKQSLGVEEVMSQSIYYVHEEQYLSEILQVIIKNSQEMFIVVNRSQEYVGIITAREILKSLVGTEITDEFDSYDNREKVAAMFNAGHEVTDIVEEGLVDEIPEDKD